MANILPTDIFTGYEVVNAAGAVTADSIVIPLSNFEGLTAEETNALTGDGREIARQIDEVIYAKLQAMATEDRPTKMTWVRTIGTITGDNRRITYQRTYDLEAPINALELVAEA